MCAGTEKVGIDDDEGAALVDKKKEVVSLPVRRNKAVVVLDDGAEDFVDGGRRGPAVSVSSIAFTITKEPL